MAYTEQEQDLINQRDSGMLDEANFQQMWDAIHSNNTQSGGAANEASDSPAGIAEKIKINRIAAVNGKISIDLEPPEDASGFTVLYRFDKFPNSIDDGKAIKKNIMKKQYDHDSAIILNTLEQKDYYFSVFAEFNGEVDKDNPVRDDRFFANGPKKTITYSITVSKKFVIFGEKLIIFKFEGENKTFTLPDIEIVSGVGSAPMDKTSAKIFHTIPSQASKDGSIQIKIPFANEHYPSKQKNIYLKAYLKDDSLISTYQLKLKLNSNLKIS